MSTKMPKANESDLDKSIGDALDRGTDRFIGELLNERGMTHGNFENTSRVAQALKLIMRREFAERGKRGQVHLTDQQKESLEMIAHKISRIIAGDPDFDEHWDDIAGYARLCSNTKGNT